MFQWLDPFDCRVARRCLELGNVLEAANVLLASQHRQHKAVADLLADVAPQLVELARQTCDQGDALAARELIDCAARCIDLAPETRALQKHILEMCDRQQQQEQWRNRRLQQAEQWADDGRLASALGMLDRLKGDHAADRLRDDCLDRKQLLDRYVAECEDYLTREQWDAARSLLEKMRQLAPHQPQVLCLEQALREAQPASEPERVNLPASTGSFAPAPAPTERVSTGRPERFVLSGLMLTGDVLVLPQPVVTLGNHRAVWADVPIKARIHRQHALLVREPAADRTAQYRIIPFTGCDTWVNRNPVTDSRLLTDGDVLQLGNDQCQWRFLRPRPDGTAILTQARPAASLIKSGDGAAIRAVVLAADELIVSRSGDGHLTEPDLPGERIRFALRPDGWHAEVAGATMFIEDGSDPEATDRAVRFPADLMLYGDQTGEQMFGAAWAGDGPGGLRLRLR